MPILIGLFGLIATVLFFVVRAHNAAKAVQELNQDTKVLRRRLGYSFENFFGSRLARVSDPSLAAVILMIQLVRTGSPVTAQEKTQILELMEDPLGIQNVSGVFEKAWGYTTPRIFFSAVADEMLPMLREKLALPERQELVDMLSKVAEAYNGASDLQIEAIARLKTRLMRA